MQYSKLFVICFWFITLFGCASREDVVILNDRLSSLEQENNELKENVENTKKQLTKNFEETSDALRGQAAELRVMIDGLKEDTRSLSGKLEVTDHSAKTSIPKESVEKIERVVNYSSDRLTNIERYLGIETPEPQIDQKASADTPVPPENTEKKEPEKALTDKETYEAGKKALVESNMEKARESFKYIIQKFPKSSFADSAQFMIGESYYNEKFYEKAILEYQKVLEKYPKGKKVPASLLKQGLSFHNLGDKENKSNAKLVWNELISKYPKSNEAKVAKQKLKTE
ncbi:MAG: tol-pal system protein YbgF [Desulfobacterales bacterium]|nr:tol-pal system protein YbgF [Desulfobacterales bacterium]